MKKYNVNFSEKELLEYEEENLKKLSKEDFANVSGGVSIKSALLTGGLLSMALLGGVGLNSSIADASKNPPEGPPNNKPGTTQQKSQKRKSASKFKPTTKKVKEQSDNDDDDEPRPSQRSEAPESAAGKTKKEKHYQSIDDFLAYYDNWKEKDVVEFIEENPAESIGKEKVQDLYDKLDEFFSKNMQYLSKAGRPKIKAYLEKIEPQNNSSDNDNDDGDKIQEKSTKPKPAIRKRKVKVKEEHKQSVDDFLADYEKWEEKDVLEFIDENPAESIDEEKAQDLSNKLCDFLEDKGEDLSEDDIDYSYSDSDSDCLEELPAEKNNNNNDDDTINSIIFLINDNVDATWRAFPEEAILGNIAEVFLDNVETQVANYLAKVKLDEQGKFYINDHTTKNKHTISEEKFLEFIKLYERYNLGTYIPRDFSNGEFWKTIFFGDPYVLDEVSQEKYIAFSKILSDIIESGEIDAFPKYMSDAAKNFKADADKVDKYNYLKKFKSFQYEACSKGMTDELGPTAQKLINFLKKLFRLKGMYEFSDAGLEVYRDEVTEMLFNDLNETTRKNIITDCKYFNKYIDESGKKLNGWLTDYPMDNLNIIKFICEISETAAE